jgi:hypothetical protein
MVQILAPRKDVLEKKAKEAAKAAKKAEAKDGAPKEKKARPADAERAADGEEP